MIFEVIFVKNIQKNNRKSTDAQIKAKLKYANSRWRPAVYLDADKRELIEKWLTSKGYRTFNEYVCALIDKDMGIEKQEK